MTGRSSLVRRYTDPSGKATTYEFNQAGRLVKRTDADGGVYTLTRDGAGHLLSATDPQGKTQTWTYGTDGRVVSYQSASGKVTRVERDPATGFPTVLIYPDGTREERVFDQTGNLVSRKDPLGRQTQYTFTAFGQIATQTDALGRLTTYQYDSDGSLSAMVDAAGQTTRYGRDSLGRVVRVTSPGHERHATHGTANAYHE